MNTQSPYTILIIFFTEAINKVILSSVFDSSDHCSTNITTKISRHCSPAEEHNTSNHGRRSDARTCTK